MKSLRAELKGGQVKSQVSILIVIAAMEKTDWVGTRGKTTFATDHNPDWHYHQFVTAPIHLIEYDKVGETPDDAPVIWPKAVATSPTTYITPK